MICLWLIPVGGHHQQTKLFTWNQILNLWILILSKAIENISGFSEWCDYSNLIFLYVFKQKNIPAMFENLAINHAGPEKLGHSHSLCHRGWLVNKPNIFHPFQGTKRQTELSVLYLAGSQLLHRNVLFSLSNLLALRRLRFNHLLQLRSWYSEQFVLFSLKNF